MSALLEIDGLDIRFHGVEMPTVRDASLRVEAGRTTAIVGESGSGKSITALSILRLNPATEIRGSIRFGEQELTTASEAELRRLRGNRIAMVFQEPMSALNPLHTIRRQIGEALTLHQGALSNAEVEVRVRALLSEVGLEYLCDRLGHYPHQLSGGERQRVMIAMAIANRPDLLIADEPTTALDVTTQAHIMALLRELQARHNMAMLLITHDLHLVRDTAHRTVVMQAGVVVEEGETAQLLRAPAHAYTKLLLSARHATAPVPVRDDAPTLLSCRDLSVSYRASSGLRWRKSPEKEALHPLSLALQEGHTLGIVGESGSGKTTLGLAMARLIASRGRIVFQGEGIDGAQGKQLQRLRSRLQFVFQDPFASLNPRMNVGQIIREGLMLHEPGLALDDYRERTHQMMERVGLEREMALRYPHEFSGGQRQRINIARAMILSPACVIFDEPTSALDMTLQTQILDLLKTFQREHQVGYVFISHDIYAIQSISHDIIVLKDGRIVERGAAAALLAQPREAYTKALIAASGIHDV